MPDKTIYLPRLSADGFQNMATDEYLFELCRGEGISAALRFYEWKPPAVSLGYSQPFHLLDLEKCRERGIDVVRRMTGGGAILHCEELTYCFVIRRDSTRAGAWPKEMANAVSRSLVLGLSRLGVESSARGGKRRRVTVEESSGSRGCVKCDRREEPRGRRPADPGACAPGEAPHRPDQRLTDICFMSGAEKEIEVSGRKLAGCAHKFTREAFFSHGSVMTGPGHIQIVQLVRCAAGTPAGPGQASGSSAHCGGGEGQASHGTVENGDGEPARAVLAQGMAERSISLSELLARLPAMDEMELAFRSAFESVFELSLRPESLSPAGAGLVAERAEEKRLTLAATAC